MRPLLAALLLVLTVEAALVSAPPLPNALAAEPVERGLLDERTTVTWLDADGCPAVRWYSDGHAERVTRPSSHDAASRARRSLRRRSRAARASDSYSSGPAPSVAPGSGRAVPGSLLVAP